MPSTRRTLEILMKVQQEIDEMLKMHKDPRLIPLRLIIRVTEGIQPPNFSTTFQLMLTLKLDCRHYVTCKEEGSFNISKPDGKHLTQQRCSFERVEIIASAQSLCQESPTN